MTKWTPTYFNARYRNPTAIIKEVKSSLNITKKQQSLPADKISIEDIPAEIEKLKALMKVASNQLDFEKAIEIRDTINLLKRRLMKR